MFYVPGFVFVKFHVLISTFLYKNIIQPATLRIVSFGAMFLILFYNTRM
jgi:hypothetical protein